MNYEAATKLFNTRAKGRTCKPVANALRLFMEGEDFIFSTGWGNALADWTPLARLTPSNHLHLLRDLAPNANSYKNSFLKATGFGSAWSNASKYKNHEHTSRFFPTSRYRDGATTYPLAVGLVIDVATRTVIASKPDVVRTTNRKAARPVYDYVNEVGKVMSLLYRMDALQRRHEYGSRLALDAKDLPLEVLTQEGMVLVAEAAYKTGASRTCSVSQYKWEFDAAHGRRVRIEVPDHKERQFAADKNLGLKLLREKLKSIHGGYNTEAITLPLAA